MRLKRILCACLAAALMMMFSSAALAAGPEEEDFAPADAAVEEDTTTPAAPPDWLIAAVPPAEEETPGTDGEQSGRDAPPDWLVPSFEEETPEPEELPGIEEVPEAAAPPETGEVPEAGEVPETEEVPEVEELPGTGEAPEAKEPPAVEEVPAAGEAHERQDAPVVEEVPAAGEAPEAGDAVTGIPMEAESLVLTPPETAEAAEGEIAPLSYEYVDDIIRVFVPDIGHMILNPYKLKVELDGVETTEQIVSETMVLINYSSVPVQVNANAVCTSFEGSKAVLVPEPPAADAAEKELFTYMEFRSSADGRTPDSPWESRFSNAQNQLLITTEGSAKADLFRLEAGSGTDPSYGVFRFLGSTAGTPAETWTEADRVNITVSFTFTAAE